MRISKGNWYMILSSLCFAFIGLFVKLMSHIPNLEINFFQSIFALMFSIMVLTRQGKSLKGNNPRHLLLRGISSGVGIVLFFITLQQLPLATANIIQNISPVFTAILGIFMLGERVSLYKWLSFAISFLGMGITYVSDFGLQVFALYSLMIGLISALMTGITNNLTSKMRDTEHPLIIFNYSILLVVIISGLYTLFYDFAILQPKDWLVLGMLGSLIYVAHYLNIQAYQLAPVAQVSAISYLSIPYALIIDLLVFDKHFHWTYLLGIILVILGVFLSLRDK